MSLFKTYAGLSRDIYYLCLARTINRMGDFIFSLITLVLTLQMGMSVVSAGIFVSMAALISGPGVLLGGYLSDLMGKKTIIISGQVLSALIIISCSFYSGTITIGYLLIAVMFFISITRPAYNALIIQLCPEEKQRKSAFSLMYLGANLGIALGPLISGFFIKDYVHIVFLSIGTVFLISTFMIWKKVHVGAGDPAAQTATENRAHHAQQPQQQQELKPLPSPLFPMLLKNPLVVFFIVVSFLNYFIYMQYSFSLPLQMNQTFGEHGAAYYGSVMTINAISVILLTTLVLSATRSITALNSALSSMGSALVRSTCSGIGLISRSSWYPRCCGRLERFWCRPISICISLHVYLTPTRGDLTDFSRPLRFFRFFLSSPLTCK
ncbi:MFS transporter [Paenibacillus sp. TC-CSREp1]|uniref:MFS transporter n=1 Tax=Paenibacillus sp. TC-CSREp1 TaxID=3410089 RepID=UPI003CFEDE92